MFSGFAITITHEDLGLEAVCFENRWQLLLARAPML